MSVLCLMATGFYCGACLLALYRPVLGENCKNVNTTYWVCEEQVTWTEAPGLCKETFGSILLQPRLQTDYDFWRSYLKSKKSYWVGGVKTEAWKAHHWENTNIQIPRTYFNEYIFDEWFRWCVSFEPQYRLMDFSHTDIIGYAFECERCSNKKGYVCQKPLDPNDDMMLHITINTNSKLEATPDENTVTDSQDNVMSKTTFETKASTDYKLIDFSAIVYSVTISNENTATHLDANTSFVVPNNINSMSVTRTSDNSMALTPSSVNDMALTPSSVNDVALTPSSVNDMALTLSSVNDMALTPSSVNDVALTLSSVNDMALTPSSVNDMALTPSSVNDVAMTLSNVNDVALTLSNVNDVALTLSSVNDMALTLSSVNDMALTLSSVNDMALTLSSVNDMALTPSNANMMSLTTTPTLELSTSVLTPGITNENTLRASSTSFLDSKDTNTITEESPTILTELSSFRQNTTAAASIQQLFSNFSFILTSSSSTPTYTMDYAQASLFDSLPPYATLASSSANLTSCSTTSPYATKYAMAASSYSTPTSATYTVIPPRYLCHCKCSTQVANQNYQTSLPRVRKEEILIEIKSRLHVDVKNSSTTIRRLTCAEDKRKSAQTVGSFAVIALVIVFGGIIVLDLSRLVQCVTRSQARSLKKKPQRRNMTKMNSG